MDIASGQAAADDPRFGGLARLFGTAGVARLRRSRVLVVGIGGVGSWAAEALVRSGIGAVDLMDLDDVCVTNVNRQLHATASTIGQPKVEAMAARLREVAPDCAVNPVAAFFRKERAAEQLGAGYDAVIDAIDALGPKAALLAAARERGILAVTSGGAGGRRGAGKVVVTDLGEAQSDPLLRTLRKKLRRDHGFPKGEGVHFGLPAVSSTEAPVFPWSDGTCSAEPEPGSSLRLDCSTGFGTAVFVTGAFGLAAAGEVVRRLAASSPLRVPAVPGSPA